jgi:hypothetical protein
MKNHGASIRTKLLSLAKAEKIEFTALLIRYATDRLLYRISQSGYKNSYVLKGSLLFSVWNEEMHRPTKDADFLSFGEHEKTEIAKIFHEICSLEFPYDGMVFDVKSIIVEPIREEEEYDGNRVTVNAYLDGAKVLVQIDIGFGDIVTPETENVNLPTYLGMPEAELRAYPKETVISEKTEALVKLGIANSRMKDFFDIKWLADNYKFDGALLSKAIVATFERRKTKLPTEQPMALTPEFYNDDGKKRQWTAFAKKLGLEYSLEEACKRLGEFLLPILETDGKDFSKSWTPDDGWS